MPLYIFGGDDVEARTGGGTPRLAAQDTLVSVFTDSSGTTAATGFRSYPSGDSLVDVRVNDQSQLPLFYLLDDVLDTLYVQINGGPITPINSHPDPRLDSMATQITGIQNSIANITGVLTLGVGESVPPGTPAGTLIVRPA